MIEFKEKHHDELRKFSSGPIQNEVLTITSEPTYYEDHFERKFQATKFSFPYILLPPDQLQAMLDRLFQAKISPYDQIFKKR